MQRLRVKFNRGEPAQFVSHLDMMRLWQRAFHRAGLPLAYSEGFKPHPRISLAAPLVVGMTAEAELMDVFLAREVSPHRFIDSVNRVLPEGVQVIQVLPVPLEQPSLPALLSFAEYRVIVPADRTEAEIQAGINRLLALERLPWQHQRDTGPHSYDLRALVADVWIEDLSGGCCTLGMKLRCDTGGSGRPEQVTLAIGFPEHPRSIIRTRLIMGKG